jgi:hypothetical protein
MTEWSNSEDYGDSGFDWVIWLFHQGNKYIRHRTTSQFTFDIEDSNALTESSMLTPSQRRGIGYRLKNATVTNSPNMMIAVRIKEGFTRLAIRAPT